VPAFRLIATAVLAAALVAPLTVPTPARAAVAPVKVAFIVGPMGSSTTASNRSRADSLAAQAVALGATVTKAYSPSATYAKVRSAVAGANIVVYFGHGNGYPNPYGTTFRADRVDGWGLNTATTNGDADSWSDGTLVYCGEKALEGKLTSTDGAAQRKYCGAGAIAPAPGFVMVYIGSCYTAGGNENGSAAATNADARLHLAYFSRPVITALGGSGYFAGRASGVIASLLTNPDESYGDIYNDNLPSDVTAYDIGQALVPGAREWLSRQSSDPYWAYAFAGDPARTFAGGTSTFTAPTATADFLAPKVRTRSPASGATGVSTSAKVVVTFTEAVRYATTNLSLWRGTTKLSATVTYDATTFTATLTPASHLSRGVTYTVKVGSWIRDMANNRISASKWSFKTVN
jgi:Big-like domain-containing protein